MNREVTMRTRRQRLRAALGSPRAPWLACAVALLLVSPCLRGGLVLDDNVFELLSRDDPGIRGFHSRPLELLTFTTGVPRDNRALMDEGALLPWWAHELHTNALFRPLSVLTHRLDLWLWPHSAAAMHAHSMLWFLVLLLAVSRLYQRIGPRGWVSGLSLLMFAWDDVHGPTVGWIANRNALLSATGIVLAVLFHHRWRSEAARWAPVAASFGVAMALGSAESGITVYAYLFAYALWLDRKGFRSALISLWPYAVLALLWRVAYKHGGYGTFASEVYLDPGQRPLESLSALLRNLPCLLASQFGPGVPFADLVLWGSPSWRPWILGLACADVLLMIVIASPTLRDKPEARFWATGLLLAAAPLTTSAAGDRLLLPVGIGASALTAQIIASLASSLGARDLRSSTRGRAVNWAHLSSLLLANVVIAPLALPLRTVTTDQLGRAVARADQAIPATPDVTEKTVVVVNAPVDILLSYIQLSRARRQIPRPRNLYWLATASSDFEIERTAANGLRLTKVQGLLYSLPERHYRASWLPLHLGEEVELSEMRARIRDVTQDGRPRVVDFTFREPLEASRYLFLTWRGGELVPFHLPKSSEIRSFPAETLFSVLSAHSAETGAL